MDMNKGSNQLVAIAVIIALIAGAWYVGRKQALNSLAEGTASPAASDVSEELSASGDSGAGEEEGTSSGSAESASVNVADQPAGTEITVSSLALSNMGWVGVRDADGRVLGAGRFEAGNFKDVTVPLLRTTVAGDSYQVLLYVDDGDRVFDLHKDILITDTNDSVGGTTFRAL